MEEYYGSEAGIQALNGELRMENGEWRMENGELGTGKKEYRINEMYYMTHKKIFFIIIYLLFPLLAFEKADANPPEKKEWIKDQKLTWDDFKGRPDPNSMDAAVTNSGFQYNLRVANDSIKFVTSCYFNRDLSWVKVRTDYILSHEQLHFDITEYYKRKFENQALTLIRKAKSKNYTALSKNIELLFAKIKKENNAAQDLYDKETNHSKNKTMQGQWRKKYNELLQVNY